jgi:primary-amine oxidase
MTEVTHPLDPATGESTDVVVSLTRQRVVSARTVDTATEGQPPIVDSEYELVEEIVRADPGWQQAMARRGLTDMSKLRICPARRTSRGRRTGR